MALPIQPGSGEIVVHAAEIEQPLRDGHQLHAFSSGGGLRVVRIETTDGELVGYGEAPQVEEALVHAAKDYQLGHETYEQQYSGENSRYDHYLTGTTEVSSPLDGHLRRGLTVDARKGDDEGKIVVSLEHIKFPPEIPEGLQERVVLSMQPETFEERGVTYVATPYQFPGNGEWGISTRVIANPHDIPTTSYRCSQLGFGATFSEAVDAAFQAPEVEIM